MKIARFTTRFVESFPRPLEEGVLYVSSRFATAGHNCACGCGHEVITPLKPTQWKLSVNGDGAATLYPSIGNWGLPCRSHYWIETGQVVWSYEMSASEIHRNREFDEAARKAYYQRKNRPGIGAVAAGTVRDFWRRLWRRE